ncbi:MAG: radical SAM family heme chaperone HemW [Parvibaculaceae bacterium]|nr:radical SAM family heme chaperone HemW [Parvibaculaceae bacterium]
MGANPSSRRPEDSAPLDDGTPGFGIYIHWPFCLSKCPYCDFNSHVDRKVDEARFVDAIIAELRHNRELTGPRPVTSIFFGGGTPSLLTPQSVERLLIATHNLWPMTNHVEISMEANPTSVETAYLQGYRAAGVTRLSLGVQALRDEDLRFLGRLHTVGEALQAVKLARETFPRISFDLIYARPAQTPQEWKQELEEAISYAADHLSLYQLTIEPGTPFEKLHHAGALIPPDPESAASLYDVTQEVCGAAGLDAYEVSNHARPGDACRHNLTYWRYGDYVGVGPGAHGRLTINGEKRATETLLMPTEWLAQVEALGHGRTRFDGVAGHAQADEMMMMGLRLKEGVSLSRFETLRGKNISTDRLTHLLQDGFLKRQDDRLIATPKGRMVLNGVLKELLS